MRFPLTFSFKISGFRPQLRVTDRDGGLIYYVSHRLLNLKDGLTVYADENEAHPLYQVKTDAKERAPRRYLFVDSLGNELGGVKRRGSRSTVIAPYDILDGKGSTSAGSIEEEDGWAKTMGAMIKQVDLLRILLGNWVHPEYLIRDPEGKVLATLKKRPSSFEQKFVIESPINPEEAGKPRTILAIMMMIMLDKVQN